jgi:hypothetical protein
MFYVLKKNLQRSMISHSHQSSRVEIIDTTKARSTSEIQVSLVLDTFVQKYINMLLNQLVRFKYRFCLNHTIFQPIEFSIS